MRTLTRAGRLACSTAFWNRASRRWGQTREIPVKHAGTCTCQTAHQGEADLSCRVETAGAEATGNWQLCHLATTAVGCTQSLFWPYQNRGPLVFVSPLRPLCRPLRASCSNLLNRATSGVLGHGCRNTKEVCYWLHCLRAFPGT